MGSSGRVVAVPSQLNAGPLGGLGGLASAQPSMDRDETFADEVQRAISSRARADWTDPLSH